MANVVQIYTLYAAIPDCREHIYPERNAASSRLNHCNCFSQYRGSLAEGEETIRKDDLPV